MEQLFQYLWLGLIATGLDVDNAVYMTTVVQQRPEDEKRRLILWGLLVEYVGRILLILVVLYLASGKEVLFTVSGFKVTLEVLSLFIAGALIFRGSTKELIEYFEGKAGEPSADVSGTFSNVLWKMTTVNLILSTDTVIAVATETQSLVGVAIIFSVSAGIRFLFVDKIAKFISENPELQIVMLSFMSLIGLELIAKAFHKELPETVTNLVIVAAILVAVYAKNRGDRRANKAE